MQQAAIPYQLLIAGRGGTLATADRREFTGQPKILACLN
jgi:hypothetical protein